MQKNTIIIAGVLILGIGGYLYFRNRKIKERRRRMRNRQQQQQQQQDSLQLEKFRNSELTKIYTLNDSIL